MSKPVFFGIDYWRQASYSDLVLFESWCNGLSERCWKTGESGLWLWFSSICMIEQERRKTLDAEPMCWDLPTAFYCSPQRVAAAALDARALLTLCRSARQRRMVDHLLFVLLDLLRTATEEPKTEAAEEQPKVDA